MNDRRRAAIENNATFTWREVIVAAIYMTFSIVDFVVGYTYWGIFFFFLTILHITTAVRRVMSQEIASQK